MSDRPVTSNYIRLEYSDGSEKTYPCPHFKNPQDAFFAMSQAEAQLAYKITVILTDGTERVVKDRFNPLPEDPPAERVWGDVLSDFSEALGDCFGEIPGAKARLAEVCARFLHEQDFGVLPIQGKEERAHLYHWIMGEESYVEEKFGDQRGQHDIEMRQDNLAPDGWWYNQIVQYFGRAQVFLDTAGDLFMQDDHESARAVAQRGTQALAKAFLTAKGMVESAIRVYGPLPAPGVSSGNIKSWNEE